MVENNFDNIKSQTINSLRVNKNYDKLYFF